MLIFFLSISCYGISLSQLEELQKARKNLTAALNEYNAIAQMENKKVTAWKKKVQGYFAVIEKYDPQDAAQLKESMVDPTVNAVDAIIKQNKESVRHSEPTTKTSKEQKVVEKPVNQTVVQSQPVNKVSLIEAQKINTAKTEIEAMIQVHRQSPDWYTRFEDLLKKIDPKDADAYRARIPEQKIATGSQEKTGQAKAADPAIVLQPTDSKKNLKMPENKTKQDQSVPDPQPKSINEQESKGVIQGVIDSEVAKPVEPIVVIQGQPAKPTSSKKKLSVVPGQTKKNQSAVDTQSKSINEQESKVIAQPVDFEVAKPVEPIVVIEKKDVKVADAPAEKEQLIDPVEKTSKQSSKTKKVVQKPKREKIASKRSTRVTVKSKVVERKIEQVPPVTSTSEIDDVNQTAKPADVQVIQPEVVPVKSDEMPQLQELLPQPAQEPVVKPAIVPVNEPKINQPADDQTDDDLDFFMDINNV